MAQDPEDFESMLAQFEQEQTTTARKDPRVGDKVSGPIVSIGREHAFVDLGSKSEGAIELDELRDEDGKLTVEVGDVIEASVAKKDGGTLILRSRLGRGVKGKAELENAFQTGIPVEGVVTGVNKGGVEVQVAGVRAFCPASQLDIRFIEDTNEFVGQRLSFVITKYDVDSRGLDVVLSRRRLLEQEQRAAAEETRARLEVGAILPGTVTSLKDYGAFIDLGGIEGMVHISELGFGRVAHPKDVLAVGQQVEVVVLKIEKTDNPKRPEKIGLSIRALEKDPWQDADVRFPVGARVNGTVSRLQPFGAFVELAPGVEGLVHISELGAGRRVSHPREVVQSGQAVEATVLSVELDKRRIGLSLGAVKAADAAAAEKAAYSDYNEPRQSLGTFGDLLKNKLNK